jgi:hypothetical protein
MPQLHIALQEGFAHDEVIVRVAGREVYRNADLSTRLQIGYADACNAAVAVGEVAVGVTLPRRRAAEQTLTVSVVDDTYLGISIAADGTLRVRVSATPFGYV